MNKKFSFYQASLAISLIVSATIISFKEYFLVNPFAGVVDIISSLQAISLAALLILILVPPLLLSSNPNGSKLKFNLLIFAAIAWPLTLLLLRVVIWRATGMFVVDYWLSYPILLLCEFGPAAIYVYVATVGNSSNKINEVDLNKPHQHKRVEINN